MEELGRLIQKSQAGMEDKIPLRRWPRRNFLTGVSLVAAIGFFAYRSFNSSQGNSVTFSRTPANK